MTTVNDNVFAELLQKTVPVTLPSIGKTVSIRRMPFATTLRTLVDIAAIAQDNLATYKVDMDAAFAVLAEEGKQDSERGLKFGARIFPVITNVIAASPEIINHILRDVLIGATDEVMAALPTEDAIAVVLAAFNAMDKDVVVGQVSSLFFGVAGVMKKTREAAPEKKQPVEQQAPLPEEDGQE